MTERQTREIGLLVSPAVASDEVVRAYWERLGEGRLTRDEDRETHFCIYFAAYDPGAKEVFIGHHKKSGLWLFNGGHLDLGETPKEALRREMGEEWGETGVIIPDSPTLLTVTEIVNNPSRVLCKQHFYVWYAIPVTKTTFAPDPVKLETEFYETRWMTLSAARSLVTDPNSLEMLVLLEKKFNGASRGSGEA